MGYVYLSYSRQNAEIAQRLVQDLQQRGYTLWIDTADLAPGTRWSDQIETAIREAEVFITLLSPAAQNRTIHNEIEIARAAGKPIIPVILEPTTIPASLANHQVVNAAGDWDSFLNRLVNAVDASTASLQIRQSEPTRVADAATAAMPMAQRATPKRGTLRIVIISLIVIVLLATVIIFSLASLAPTVGNVFSNVVSNLEITLDGTETQQLDGTEFWLQVTAIAANQTATPTIPDEGPESVTEVPQSPTLQPTESAMGAVSTPTSDSIESMNRTATAIIERATNQAMFRNADMTATAIIQRATNVAFQELVKVTEIAAQVEGTVAAAIATENSQLSPAEAALLIGLTSDNNDTTVFLIGILAAVALGISVTTLVLSRTGTSAQRPRPRAAHHHSGTPGQPQTVLPKMLLEDYQIFTSSSEKDKEWVRILVEDLEALGYAVWWYAKDAPGLPFGNEIRSAIYHTKVFLIILSPDSMKSKHIEEEIRWAEIYDRPIIPVECRPTSIEERFYGLAKGSDIDFTSEIDYKESLEYLTQAIDHHLQQRLEQLNIEDTHGSD